MKHVVAISGGKDSCALALRLRELRPEIEYTYLCTPTGNEPAAVFEHLDRMSTLLKAPIVRLGPYDEKTDGLYQLIADQKMIPNHRARFCTRMLKIEPTLQWLAANAPVTHYVGLRADEPMRDGIYGDVEGVKHHYPMRDWGWGIEDVWDYLDKIGVTIPKRTDCKVCYHQKLIEWFELWRDDKPEFDRMAAVESQYGHTLRSEQRDTWPAALSGLGAEFAKGRRPRGYENQQQRQLFNCDREDTCRVCSM